MLVHMINRDLCTVSYEAAVKEAAQMMRQKKIGALLVEKDGRYIGVVTETDLVRKGIAEGADLKAQTVSSLMTSPILSIEIERSPEEATNLMRDHGVRHLAVTERGTIVGILSVRDLLVYYKKVSEPKMGID